MDITEFYSTHWDKRLRPLAKRFKPAIPARVQVSAPVRKKSRSSATSMAAFDVNRFSHLRPVAVAYERPAIETPKVAAKSRSSATSMAAFDVNRFSHLRPVAVAYERPAIETPKVAARPRSVDLASRILAAGQRAKTPTGTGAPKPTGLAAEIIAAGKKRRGLEFA